MPREPATTNRAPAEYGAPARRCAALPAASPHRSRRERGRRLLLWDTHIHGDYLARVLASGEITHPTFMACAQTADRQTPRHPAPLPSSHPRRRARRRRAWGPGGVHLLDDPGLHRPYLPRESSTKQGVDDEVGHPKFRVEVFLDDESHPGCEVSPGLSPGPLVLALRRQHCDIDAGAV